MKFKITHESTLSTVDLLVEIIRLTTATQNIKLYIKVTIKN